MTVINMHDAKTQLSDLVARAEAGEEIVIARRNRPAVRLVPVEARGGTNEPRGFAEDGQAELDIKGLRHALESGRPFTIMQDGKPVATVAPAVEKQNRVPGRFAHLRGTLPADLFDRPLELDELDAWEGKYSNDDVSGLGSQ